jgi:hypothetical protein
MPSYTRGVIRDQLTAVKLSGTYAVYSIFTTKDFAALPNVSAADLLLLGHINLTTTPLASGSIGFLRARSPAPSRVSKKIGSGAGNTQKRINTFCGTPELQAALRGGWNLSKSGHGVGLRNDAQIVTALAQLSNGSYHAFPMNKNDYDNYGAALGLLSSTTVNTDAERAKVFSGASLPRAGRASIVLSTRSTFSSFFSTATNVVSGGYSILSEEVLF